MTCQMHLCADCHEPLDPKRKAIGNICDDCFKKIVPKSFWPQDFKKENAQ